MSISKTRFRRFALKDTIYHQTSVTFGQEVQNNISSITSVAGRKWPLTTRVSGSNDQDKIRTLEYTGKREDEQLRYIVENVEHRYVRLKVSETILRVFWVLPDLL